MNLKQLEYVVEISRSGSINKAAQNLYLAQPSLSASVRQLEQELGFSIFRRKNSGIELTSEGKLMLLAAKLQKFGGISIMGLVMGLFFFVSGHFVLSFAANIVCGVLADWVASRSQYRSKKVLLASYVIFSYGLTGPILPLWFMKDAYIANLTARGKDAAYIDTLFAPINNGSFVAAIAAILVCAVLGGLFGQRMMKKHFEKAGIL